ncbi:MAG TPA: hypothetical protein VLG25_02815 [Patescibacteria group bacterium]|nr:hypothetical protein [Patescibacteria group bacterium]
MSEKLHHNEHVEVHHDLSGETKKNLERLHEKAENAHEISHEQVEELRKSVEHHAKPSHEVGHEEQEQIQPSGYAQKELKLNAYNRTIKHVRSQLNAPERVLSRLVHQPLVEKISDVSAVTIARPSGLLAGGFFSAIGSLVVLYMAKRNGFTYNRLVFVILFGGGFIVGLLVELMVKLLTKKSRLRNPS